MSVSNQREEYLQSRTIRHPDVLELNPYANYKELTERDYYCANTYCRRYIISKGIPRGWYVVKKSHGPDETLRTLAITCSIECMAHDVIQAMTANMRNRY